MTDPIYLLGFTKRPDGIGLSLDCMLNAVILIYPFCNSTYFHTPTPQKKKKNPKIATSTYVQLLHRCNFHIRTTSASEYSR